MIGGAVLGAVAPSSADRRLLAICPSSRSSPRVVAIVLARPCCGAARRRCRCAWCSRSPASRRRAVQFRLWNVVRDDGPISTVGTTWC